jgi:nucleoside-diphosphate-sugar epimerase|eukprot:COSAG06_NODE_3898_length_4793_cov_22.160844_1_plen_269_part_00
MAIYLTGGSGYLGGEIVRSLALDKLAEDKKVLVPVREKRGKSGQERFESIFRGGGNPHKHTQWIDPAAPIPDETEVVILNAFDVAFHTDIARVLRESVAPMLALLEQCTQLRAKGNLKKVVIVSTAYVQPPIPFRRCDGPITPFNGAADPWGTYSQILNGEMVWQDLVDDPRSDTHSTTNAYIYAKTLMEHLIATMNELPRTTIVRPSVIGPSSDGERGNLASPGCASVRLMSTPIGRFVPSSGCESAKSHTHTLRQRYTFCRTSTVP